MRVALFRARSLSRQFLRIRAEACAFLMIAERQESLIFEPTSCEESALDHDNAQNQREVGCLKALASGGIQLGHLWKRYLAKSCLFLHLNQRTGPFSSGPILQVLSSIGSCTAHSQHQRRGRL